MWCNSAGVSAIRKWVSSRRTASVRRAGVAGGSSARSAQAGSGALRTKADAAMAISCSGVSAPPATGAAACACARNGKEANAMVIEIVIEIVTVVDTSAVGGHANRVVNAAHTRRAAWRTSGRNRGRMSREAGKGSLDVSQGARIEAQPHRTAYCPADCASRLGAWVDHGMIEA